MKEYEKALENLRKAENDAAKKQQELDNIINQLNETKQELEALGIKILDLGHQKSDLEIEKNKILDQLYKVNKEIINHRKRIVSDLERKINEARIDIIVNAMKKYRYQSDNGKSDDKRSPSPGINSVRKLLKELSKLEDLDYEHRKRLEDLRKHKSFRQIAIELDKLKDNENDPYWAYIIHPEEVENNPELRGLKHRLENAKNSLKQFEEQLPPEDDYYLEQLFEPGYTEVNPQEVEPEDKALEEKLKQIEQISFEEPYIPQFQQSNEQQSDQNLSGTGIHWGGQDNRLKYLMRQRQLLLNKLHELRGIGKRKVDKDNDNDNGLWTNQINSIMQKVPNFLGTIASDQFDHIYSIIKPHTRSAWITNLDPSTKPGSHWVAFVINPTATPPDPYSIMYFDPFGEDIPTDMLDDLKKIADKVAPDVMLKLKVNRIQHQDKRSSNCGYFSMNFILDILSRNKNFAQATGYEDRILDKSGKYEKEIEKLKNLPPFNYLDLHIGGALIRDKPPPKFRKFLEDHGHEHIDVIGVYRKPIMSFIQKAVDWIRKVTGREANSQYDKLFHLYIVFRLKESGTTWKMERNQVLNVVKATQNDISGQNIESKAVEPPKISIGEIFRKAAGNDPSFYRYHPINNNCQDFVLSILRAGGVLTDKLALFIKQDVKDLVPKFIGDFAAKITDAAHAVDTIIEGEGKKGLGCNCKSLSK